MNKDPEHVKTENLETQGLVPILLILTMAMGVLLLAFKVYADSEPGAIPLLIIIVSSGWYFIWRLRRRSKGRVQ